MEPEIALVAAGVETDVDGAGLNLLNPATVEEIIAHPRPSSYTASPCSSAFTGRLYDQHCYHAAARKPEQSIGNR